jgi:ABC-type phosphate transport system permease subunit
LDNNNLNYSFIATLKLVATYMSGEEFSGNYLFKDNYSVSFFFFLIIIVAIIIIIIVAIIIIESAQLFQKHKQIIMEYYHGH